MGPAEQLLHRYLDQLATPAEQVELGRLLAARPELCEALAEAARTEALLQAHFLERRTHDRVAAALAVPQQPARLPFRPWRWAAAVLLLCVGAVLGLGFIGRSGGTSDVVSGRVLVQGVEAL